MAENEDTEAPSPGDFVVVGADPRGLARLDRWIAPERARVFFFVEGRFEVVARRSVVAAPVGAGAPAHVDMLTRSAGLFDVNAAETPSDAGGHVKDD